MSSFVISNLIVTAGMLTPGLQVRRPMQLLHGKRLQVQATGTLLWQITNQSLNVAINSANANKSTPISTSTLVKSYFLAVSASCSVALGLNAIVPRLKGISPGTKTILARLVPFAAVASAGALNVFLMRGEEIRQGIDVYPVLSEEEKCRKEKDGMMVPSLGKSKRAATLAVGETAFSRVLNSTPIMVLPPLVLVRLQQTRWLKSRPKMTLPINLGANEKENLLWVRKNVLIQNTRTHPDHIDICTSVGPGRISPAASCRCQELGGKILESRGRGWESGIQPGNLMMYHFLYTFRRENSGLDL